MGAAPSAAAASGDNHAAPRHGKRLKVSGLGLGAVNQRVSGLVSQKYKRIAVLDVDKPDRYYKSKRLDKFRALDEVDPALQVKRPVWAFDLARSTMMLAAALADSNVHIWDLLMVPPELVVTLRAHEAHVWAVAYSPNELALATGSSDKTVRIWAAETGVPLQVLHAHTEGVRCLAFSADGLLLSGGMDSQMCLWEYETSVPSAQWKAHDGHVHAISFVPSTHPSTANRGLALSVGADGAVCAWQVVPGNYRALGKFPGGNGKGVLCVAQHTTMDNWCACGNEDGAVWVWQFQPDTDGSGEHCKITGNFKMVGHKQSVRAVAFSPDGCLLASGSSDCTIRVWDVRRMCDPGHEVLCKMLFRAHESWITDLCFFGKPGRQIVTSSADGSVTLWAAPRRIAKLRAKEIAQSVEAAALQDDEEGLAKWSYAPDDAHPLALRAAPQLGASRTGWFLHPGEVFCVAETATDGRVTWLRIADDLRHGWAYSETPEGLALCRRMPKELTKEEKLAAKADITKWTEMKDGEKITDFSKSQLKQVRKIFEEGSPALADDDDDESSGSEAEDAESQVASMAGGAAVATAPASLGSTASSATLLPLASSLGASSKGAFGASAGSSASSATLAAAAQAEAAAAAGLATLPGGLPPPPPPPPAGGGLPGWGQAPSAAPPRRPGGEPGQLDPRLGGALLQARLVVPRHRAVPPRAVAKALGAERPGGPDAAGAPSASASAADLAH